MNRGGKMKKSIILVIILALFLACDSPTQYVTNNIVETESWGYTVQEEDVYYDEYRKVWAVDITDPRIDSNSVYEIYAQYWDVWLKLEMYYYAELEAFIYMQIIQDKGGVLSMITHGDFTGYSLKIYKINGTF